MRHAPRISASRHNAFRASIKKSDLKRFTISAAFAIAVFIRLSFAERPFSFDYGAYINIFEAINALSYSQILGSNFIFPYTIAKGVVPIEFGFALLIKTVSLFVARPETIFATIASISVGLRVHVMRSVGMTVTWIVLMNIIAITLFEANALRLGIAISILVLGLRLLHSSKKVSGFLATGISLTFHLQLIFFVAPFVFFYVFLPWVTRSRLRMFFALSATSAATAFLSQYLSLVDNEKVQQYVSDGHSSSAGITVTSTLGFFLLVSIAMALRLGRRRNSDSRLYSAVVSASVPALAMLIFLTNVAVIGDRAWQLAFFVLVTFFFTDWARKQEKTLAFVSLSLLTAIVITNVGFRYPLSNFFSPPFPTISQH